MTKGPLAQEMEGLLTAAFAPTKLAVINDSAKHHGHSGDDGSGESHFTIEIESAAFAGVLSVVCPEAKFSPSKHSEPRKKKMGHAY